MEIDGNYKKIHEAKLFNFKIKRIGNLLHLAKSNVKLFLIDFM